MPTLTNPRHEAFAQARARGARLDVAYEIAGFVPGHRHSTRLARQPEVAERIGELLAAHVVGAEADIHTVIEALLRLAETAPTVANPAAIQEARLVLLEAQKLMAGIEKAREADRERVRYA